MAHSKALVAGLAALALGAQASAQQVGLGRDPGARTGSGPR
jgi:hypothetical protein